MLAKHSTLAKISIDIISASMTLLSHIEERDEEDDED